MGNLRHLFPYFARYKRGLFFGAIFVLCTNLISVQFGRVIIATNEYLSKGSVDREKLAYFAGLVLLISVSKGVFLFLTRWTLIGISRDIEFDLRNDLFQHLESLSYDFYQRTRTGDIMARMTNDLNAVRNMLGPAIMYSANTIVFAIAALVVMWQINRELTLLVFLTLPVVSITIQYFGRRIHERFERIQASFSDITSRVQENLSGARLIRAYVQEEAEIQHFERANLEYIKRSLRLVQLMGMLFPALQLVLGFAFVLVMLVGGHAVLTHKMTGSQLSGYVVYIIQLTWPMIAFGWVINIYQRGTASMGRIAEFINEHPTITDAQVSPDLSSAIAPRGDIDFRNVSFHFPGDTRSVLEGIDLHIPAGTSLAIVGPTGSGKTTLANLIARIYDATSGTVLIDGRPIQQWPLGALRRNIGFVPQETFLFSSTIRENIAFGSEDRSMQDVINAATVAGIGPDIEQFPAKYDTVVGERGITLSGGQKQRTAIARAVIRDPRILVLDDALSSVDTYTEERILNHLQNVMRDRTTILISHRVSTVRQADKIAVLHHGRIVEYGTHEELLAADRYYTDLYNKQQLEEELAVAE